MSIISHAQPRTMRSVGQQRSALAWRRWVALTVTYFCLGALALFMMLPLLWMISGSLKLRSQIFAYPPEWIPNPLIWQNYVEVWTAYPFDLYTLNSFKVALLSVVGRLFFCSLAGYGFARFNFPLKNALFTMLMGVILVPGIINLVPRFILFKNLGLLDTHWTLITPAALANTFGTFLFRQFMLTIPVELEDAARIDGAGPFTIYRRIMLPLCKPAAAVLATFTFIGSWNEFLEPLLYLRSQEQFTVTIGLAFFRGEVGVQWHLLMAASVISLLPTVIVFLLTQRYFVQGITLTGLKG